MKPEVGDEITVAWWDGDRFTLSRATVMSLQGLPHRPHWLMVRTESNLLLTVDLREEGRAWIRGHFPDDDEVVRALAATAMLLR